jgi:hypothetical protein
VSPLEKLKEVDKCLALSNRYLKKATEARDRGQKILDSLKKEGKK